MEMTVAVAVAVARPQKRSTKRKCTKIANKNKEPKKKNHENKCCNNSNMAHSFFRLQQSFDARLLALAIAFSSSWRSLLCKSDANSWLVKSARCSLSHTYAHSCIRLQIEKRQWSGCHSEWTAQSVMLEKIEEVIGTETHIPTQQAALPASLSPSPSSSTVLWLVFGWERSSWRWRHMLSATASALFGARSLCFVWMLARLCVCVYACLCVSCCHTLRPQCGAPLGQRTR